MIIPSILIRDTQLTFARSHQVYLCKLYPVSFDSFIGQGLSPAFCVNFTLDAQGGEKESGGGDSEYGYLYVIM